MLKRLIIFLKAPQPGRVKTRLARTLGAEASCAAYRVIVEALLAKLNAERDVELRFTPDDGGPAVAGWARPGWRLRGQGEGTLGDRMGRAFQQAFAEECGRVVVIGSDCPDVGLPDIEAAWAGLATHDLVLGPAEDGGYWLIGMKEANPELWTDIAWSSDRVLSDTLNRAAASHLSVKLLRILPDIDTAADWDRWRARAGMDSCAGAPSQGPLP